LLFTFSDDFEDYADLLQSDGEEEEEYSIVGQKLAAAGTGDNIDIIVYRELMGIYLCQPVLLVKVYQGQSLVFKNAAAKICTAVCIFPPPLFHIINWWRIEFSKFPWDAQSTHHVKASTAVYLI
jgi:hypothetical protein